MYEAPLTFNGKLVFLREGVIRRSWRERLLSWPWRPWQATKPDDDPNIYETATAYYMRRREWDKIRVVQDVRRALMRTRDGLLR